MGFHKLFKVVYEHFLSPLAIVLSVVSMELLSPHKMAEIRPVRSNKELPHLRIVNLILTFEVTA